MLVHSIVARNIFPKYDLSYINLTLSLHLLFESYSSTIWKREIPDISNGKDSFYYQQNSQKKRKNLREKNPVKSEYGTLVRYKIFEVK